MEFTPPAGFLDELGDINDFITDLLECPRNSSWHWPTFYLLYVEADRLAMLLMRTGMLFDSYRPGTGGISGDGIAPDASDLLCMIDTHQKSIVGSIFQIFRSTQPAAARETVHSRVGAHVHPKSGWYQTLMHGLVSCGVDGEGRTFTRTALPATAGLSCERIDSDTAECMLRHQRFDTGSPAACRQLAEAAREAGRRLGEVQRAMGSYLLAHCRIEDLMHPCSR